jgi:hypothetical protein
MPNWKRIVVGDAFRLPSQNINYYRDLVLAWPFLLFAVVGIFKLLGHQWVLGVECTALALGAPPATRLVPPDWAASVYNGDRYD